MKAMLWNIATSECWVYTVADTVRCLFSSTDCNKYKYLMFRITALLVTSKTADRKLLHCLCLAPIHRFVEPVMEASIACWEWLLAARPDLRAQVILI